MRLLRSSLVALAWLIFFGYLLTTILNILHTNFVEAAELTGFVFTEISYFFIALPLPALLIWAAYNLGSSAFSSNFVAWMLRVSMWLTVAAIIVLLAQLVASYRQISLSFSSLGLKEILYSANYYIYSIGEICLLIFASKQLRQKQDGEQLKTLPDTNIITSTLKKARTLGDKTKLQEK